MFSDLLRMRGNGCAGSRPSGESTGRISSRKYFAQPALLRAFQASRARMRMPARPAPGAAPRSSSGTALDQLGARSWIAERRLRRQAVGAGGGAELLGMAHGAARISKNSSRLVQEMHR
jgi:hypothetical protein